MPGHTSLTPHIRLCFLHFLNVAYKCYNPAILFLAMCIPLHSDRFAWRLAVQCPLLFQCCFCRGPLFQSSVWLKGCYRSRIENEFVRLLVLGSCHEDVLGQRSDSSTHSSRRHLDECGELNVPDQFKWDSWPSLVIWTARQTVWMQINLCFCEEQVMKRSVIHQ